MKNKESKWQWWSAPSNMNECRSSSWYFAKTSKGYIAQHPILMAKGNHMQKWNRAGKTKGRALRKVRKFLNVNFIKFSA